VQQFVFDFFLNIYIYIYIVDANFWFGDVAASETSLRLELGLQNKKGSPGLAGGASSDDQVSHVFLMERELEREREFRE
jgi:hypothetical protein